MNRLTDEQIIALGNTARNTSTSLFDEARRQFPDARWENDDYERLKTLTGVLVHLTDEEIRQLGSSLENNRVNVYRKAETMFPGRVMNDTDFDRLKELASVFKCDECGTWLNVVEESEESDICETCAEGDDDEDEDDD